MNGPWMRMVELPSTMEMLPEWINSVLVDPSPGPLTPWTLDHLQVPDPSTSDAFILEVERGLDGSRLKFDMEDRSPVTPRILLGEPCEWMTVLEYILYAVVW